MFRPKPSFWLFLKNRSKLAFVILIPLFLFDIILFNYNPIKSVSDASLFSCLTVEFALLILAFSTTLLFEWKKFQEVNELFRSGAETIGEITDVYPAYPAARRLYVKYVYQQEALARFIEIPLRHRKIKSLTVGKKVTLYVNPQNPTEVVIRDLFLNTF